MYECTYGRDCQLTSRDVRAAAAVGSAGSQTRTRTGGRKEEHAQKERSLANCWSAAHEAGECPGRRRSGTSSSRHRVPRQRQRQQTHGCFVRAAALASQAAHRPGWKRSLSRHHRQRSQPARCKRTTHWRQPVTSAATVRSRPPLLLPPPSLVDDAAAWRALKRSKSKCCTKWTKLATRWCVVAALSATTVCPKRHGRAAPRPVRRGNRDAEAADPAVAAPRPRLLRRPRVRLVGMRQHPSSHRNGARTPRRTRWPSHSSCSTGDGTRVRRVARHRVPASEQLRQAPSLRESAWSALPLEYCRMTQSQRNTRGRQ